MNLQTPSPPRLVRALGPLMAVAIVIGTVIGSGIFKKPQEVAANVPNFGFAALAWVLGGVLALLGGLAYAEVAVLYPRAGGNYVFLREGYGRLAGFLWGWVEFWIIRAGSLAALATVFSDELFNILRTPAVARPLGLDPDGNLLASSNEKFMTVAVIAALALVNVRGVRWGGVLQFLITSVKVGSLTAIMALPFVVAALAGPVDSPPPDSDTAIKPPVSFSFAGMGTALLGVLWAYHGWMNIAPVAEEVKQPQRNIPLSLIGGVGIIIALYLGANIAYAHLIPQDQMANMIKPSVATHFCLRLLGPAGALAASAAVMFSVFGALNGNLLVGPRLLYAMGEDGLAPRALSAVHPRYHTPALAILVMGGWAILLVMAAALVTEQQLLSLKKPLFDILTAYAMFGAVIFETLAVATIFIFRRRFPQADRPYRCPGYPVVPAVYVAILALVAANTFFEQTFEALAGVTFIALGGVIYWVVLRRARFRRPNET